MKNLFTLMIGMLMITFNIANANSSQKPIPSISMPKAYIVYNYSNGTVYESYNINASLPIASITKLMTAFTFYNTHTSPTKCVAQITSEDIDYIKGTRSRIPKYTLMGCDTLVMASLIASDNTAAHALGHATHLTRNEFVGRMNNLAASMGMVNAKFADTSGLNPQNRASVADLVHLTHYLLKNKNIKDFSTSQGLVIPFPNQQQQFRNTNHLITRYNIPFLLSKTGYIRESGFNLLTAYQPTHCKNGNGDIILVISLGHKSSSDRFLFTHNKLAKYAQCYS